MTASWIEVEHTPLRKRAVQFTGENGADIADLVGDPTLVEWDGWELTVKNPQGDFKPNPGDWVMWDYNAVPPQVYQLPPENFAVQYRFASNGWRS